MQMLKENWTLPIGSILEPKIALHDLCFSQWRDRVANDKVVISKQHFVNLHPRILKTT